MPLETPRKRPGAAAGESSRAEASAKGAFAWLSAWDSQAPLIIGILLIAAAVFVAFWPAMQGAFIWDDEDMLVKNAVMQNPNGLSTLWFTTQQPDFFPLTYTSFWLECRLWGLQHPAGFHLTNIILHALSCILLWRVLVRLNIPGAWWAALIFAVHPMNVESVAWIAERKNTLSMVFYALALLCYLRFQDQSLKGAQSLLSKARSPAPGRHRWYWFALGAFALALLSKTSVVMFPVVLLGLAWWQKDRIEKKDVLRTIPFFALSLGLALTTIWFQYNRAIADTVMPVESYPSRLAIAGRALWFYLDKSLLPLNLTFVYPRWVIDPRSIVSYLPGVAWVGCMALFFAFRKSWGRPFLFALGYFAVVLFPVLGFFKIYFFRYSFVADHYVYTSLIAITALVIALVGRFLPKPAALLFLAVTIACACASRQQSSVYKDQPSLWADTLAKDPRSWMAHFNWAYYLQRQAEALTDSGNNAAARETYARAYEHFDATVKLKPDDAASFYNMGVILSDQNQTAGAIAKFEEALRIKPDYLEALSSLSWILAVHGQDAEKAVKLAQRAVALTHEEDAWKLDILAAAYAATGQFQEAIQAQTKALNLLQGSQQSDSFQGMVKRLNLYQARRPYREE